MRWLTLLGLLGCRDAELAVTAEVNEQVATVIQLSWSTQEPGRSRVRFGEDGGLDRETPWTSEGTQHSVELLGLPALAEIGWEAVTEVEGAEISATGSATTGGLPAELPELQIAASDDSLISDEPYLLGVTLSSEVGALFAIDRQGRWLWYRLLEVEAGEVSLATTEISFARGSNELLYNVFAADLDPDHDAIHRVSMAAEELDRRPLRRSHHAFTELPDGALAYLAVDPRVSYDPDLRRQPGVMGDLVMELAPDGSERVVLSSWDWRQPEHHERWDITPYPFGGDWTHANNLEYHEDTGTYLISLGHLDTVLEVDRHSGEVLREFGEGGIPVAEGELPFHFQHGACWTPEDTLLLTSSRPGERGFLALEYQVGERELRQVWSHELDSTAILGGQALRLGNGNTLVNGGSLGLLQEVTPYGELAWELQTPAGSIIWHVQPFFDFYEGQ